MADAKVFNPLTPPFDEVRDSIADLTTKDHHLLDGLGDDDHTQYLLANATRALTADWDAGPFHIQAEHFISDIATGTAPYQCTSTTVNTNLNADMLDGKHTGASGNVVPLMDGTNTWSGSQTFDGLIIIDITDTEALLVRKNADGGDIFTVDTTNSVSKFGGSGRSIFNEGIVVNEGGTASDSRFEGDNDANLIYLDATNDRFGIGTSSPAVKLHISQASTSTLTCGVRIENTDTGDALLTFKVAATSWSVGIDNSASDNYTICYGSSINPTNFVTAFLATGTANEYKIGMWKTTPASPLHVNQPSSTYATTVLTLEQTDQDETFIDFVGTSAADQTKSISTVNGDGVVDGPYNKVASAGWTYAGMVRVDINGTQKWMPYYTAQP
jgi:hypothetical protein